MPYRRLVLQLLAAAALVQFLVACGAPPVEQIRSFSDGVHDMRKAGDAVLDRVAPILVSAGAAGATTEADCGSDRFGVPKCFDPSLVGTGRTVADPASVAVRRRALETVAAYSTALVALADGSGEAEARAVAHGVADAASGLAALLGASVGGPVAALAIQGLREPLAELAGQAAAAGDRAAVREALLANRELIKSILAALERDTPNLYEIYYTKRLDDRRAALLARDARAAEAAGEDTRRFHEALDAYVKALRATSRTLDVLAEAAAEAGRPSPQNVAAAIQQAVEFRVAARSFLDAARRVGETAR